LKIVLIAESGGCIVQKWFTQYWIVILGSGETDRGQEYST
jgi:hypothetical protein